MSRADYSNSDSTEVARSESIGISTDKMPMTRRRRPLLKLSSSPVDTVDAQGTAHLCFTEDHSVFQGNISTDDESNYSLYGERISVEDNNNEEGKKVDGDTASETDYYRVTMIDHFSGQKYLLPRIASKKETPSSPTSVGHLFTSKHGEVTFQVENAYKGQKADIMIHRYLGSPTLLGKKCVLYSGQINILFNDMGETGRSWSL